jgi:hypothetical protein
VREERAVRAAAWGLGARLGSGPWLVCLLVLGLCLTHQLFMATEQHATVIGSVHERGTLRPLGVHAALSAGPHGAPAEPGPPAHHTTLGECPAQRAVLPVLLAMLALAGALLALRRDRRRLVNHEHLRGWQRGLVPPALPPLPATRRRALLQVFLN